jgi:hypothetical protein
MSLLTGDTIVQSNRLWKRVVAGVRLFKMKKGAKDSILVVGQQTTKHSLPHALSIADGEEGMGRCRARVQEEDRDSVRRGQN